MERAILNHKVARELLNVCSERETGLTGEIGGRNFKALLDASSRAGVILDLKKVQDAREHVFQSTVQGVTTTSSSTCTTASTGRELLRVDCRRGGHRTAWRSGQ